MNEKQTSYGHYFSSQDLTAFCGHVDRIRYEFYSHYQSHGNKFRFRFIHIFFPFIQILTLFFRSLRFSFVMSFRHRFLRLSHASSFHGTLFLSSISVIEGNLKRCRFRMMAVLFFRLLYIYNIAFTL